MTEHRLTRIGTTELKPGWTEGLSMSRYLGDAAVSASLLWGLHQRPTLSHFRHEAADPPAKKTDARDLGDVLHTLAYEPDAFESRYVVLGRCEAKKADCERCENPGTIWKGGGSYCGRKSHAPTRGASLPDDAFVVKEDVKATAREMEKRLLEHPITSMILRAPGPREIVGVWKDETTGLWCRIRPDQLIEDPPVVPSEWHFSVPNLKSTGRGASDDEFRKQSNDLGYYFKAAFYRMGIDALCDWWPQHFLYPVVESFPPHEPTVFRLHEDALDIGEAEVRSALDQLAHALKTDRWPGYGPHVRDLNLPEWRLRLMRSTSFLEVA